MDDWSLPPYRFDDDPQQEQPSRGASVQKESWTKRLRLPLIPDNAVLAMTISAGAGLLVAIGLSLFIWNAYLKDVPPLPPRAQLYVMNRAPGMRFYDRAGQLIATRGPRYGEKVTLTQLPAYVPRAFLAAEDRRFYSHGAIDLYGILRAALTNLQAGRVVQGGSTLTQQLAKGLFLTPDQTVKRKLQEIVMAQRLGQLMSKDEILELYLNRIFFGANTFGIDGASHTYFGKSATELTIAESALLASLPKAPSRLALTRGMNAAIARSHLILANMRKEGWITPEEEDVARAHPPSLSADALKDEGAFGYVLDYAASEAVKRVGANSPDLAVYLTLDSRLQQAGVQAVRQAILANGARAHASQGALLSLADDGSIRAMVGGFNYDDSPFNRAVQARRQPGSTFKPFTYAAALEKGVLPTDVREDGPVQLGDWAPTNYGGGYKGTVTIEQALMQSINTVAVKLAAEVGGNAIGALLHRFGFSTVPDSPNLTVALGAYEVNLLDLVSGFQVFQQGGRRLPPYLIARIDSLDGHRLYTRQQSVPVTVYDVTNASMMVHMMKKVVESGTGTRAAFGPPVAGKTGTSQNWRDAWFVGFSADYATGVWIGNDDDRPMNRVVGGDLPASVWRRFMIAAQKGLATRDFDWLLPEVSAATEPDPRNSFYAALADDLGREASEPAVAAETPPPADSMAEQLQ